MIERFLSVYSEVYVVEMGSGGWQISRAERNEEKARCVILLGESQRISFLSFYSFVLFV